MGVNSLLSPSLTISIRGIPINLKEGRQWETYSKHPNIDFTVIGFVGICIFYIGRLGSLIFWSISVFKMGSEKLAEISKLWLQVWIPPTKSFKTVKIT